MERNVIRDLHMTTDCPGLRFAPSGLQAMAWPPERSLAPFSPQRGKIDLAQVAPSRPPLSFPATDRFL